MKTQRNHIPLAVLVIMTLAQQWKTILLVFVISSGIAACNSSSSDDLDDDIDDSKKDRQADIGFVNALDEQAIFYVKAKVLSRDIFASEQIAADVLGANTANYALRFNDGTEKNDFGVRDSATQSKSAVTEIKLNDQAAYWVIAWLDGNAYQLTGFNKSTADEAGVFKVRVFSSTAMPVKINGNETIATTTEKGKVTTHFSIDDCETGLNVGGNPIDFCNDAVFGNSYLAVVDSNGKVVVAQE